MAQKKITSTQIDTVTSAQVSVTPGVMQALTGSTGQDVILMADNLFLDIASTGVRFGGQVTVNGGDPAKVDISGGEGTIADNTDPSDVQFYHLFWSAATALTPPSGVSYYYVNNAGTIVNTATAPTSSQRRVRVYLARVSVSGGVVTGIASILEPTQNMGPAARDYATAIGPIRKDGLVVSAGGANLTLQVSSGNLMVPGQNFHTDPTSPNTVAFAALTAPATFRMAKQDGVIATDVTNMPVTQYDNAGTLTNVPNGSNATIFTFFLFAGGNFRVLYDQTFYSSMATALDALPTRSIILPAGFSEAFVLGWLIVKKNCTDLSVPANALFILSNKFGIGGTSGGQGISIAAGSSTYVQYNDAGTLAGDADLTWDSVNNVLTVNGQIQSNGTILAIPRSTTTTTAALGDRGKCIAVTGNLDIPNSTFAAGDAFSIYNDSASSVTITQGSGLTLREAGTTNTGDRTLAPRGMASLWFNSASEAIITGPGVT